MGLIHAGVVSIPHLDIQKESRTVYPYATDRDRGFGYAPRHEDTLYASSGCYRIIDYICPYNPPAGEPGSAARTGRGRSADAEAARRSVAWY